MFTQFKSTALMVAAEFGFYEIAEMLISNDADITPRNQVSFYVNICSFDTYLELFMYKDGYLALVLAAEAGHKVIVKSLCNRSKLKGTRVRVEKSEMEKLSKGCEKLSQRFPAYFWNESWTETDPFFNYIDVPNKVWSHPLLRSIVSPVLHGFSLVKMRLLGLVKIITRKL